jgi:CO/xanthine dehydrogenase FAD-binding subunit
MEKFCYRDPETVEETVRLLNENSGRAVVLSGGTDLVVLMKQGKRTPEMLVSLKHIKELKEIKLEADGSLRIGPSATLNEISCSKVVNDFQPAIAVAAASVGSNQVRNRGTIGGNICHASPSADTAPILLTLDAKVELKGLNGSRVVPLSEFFVGPGKTVIEPGELLTGILVPASSAGLKAVFLKLGVRKAMEISIASVAVALKMNDDICKTARIAFGAVAPTPMLSKKVENCLVGNKVLDKVEEAADIVMGECRPITDIRATADYRRQMIGVLVKRALEELVG